MENAKENTLIHIFDETFDPLLMESTFCLNSEEYKHFGRHPEYLPYIGDKYKSSKVRILLVMESHYLSLRDSHEVELAFNLVNQEKSKGSEVSLVNDNWYYFWNTSDNLMKKHILENNYFNTRGVAKDVIINKLNRNRVLLDPLRIYDKAV
ncbi:MAG: hypothetical protein WCI62_03930, partial [Erysipelotrichaceae bacterium]